MNKTFSSIGAIACLLLAPAALLSACGDSDGTATPHAPTAGTAGMASGGNTSAAGGHGNQSAGGASAAGQGSAGESNGAAGADAAGGAAPSEGGSGGSSDNGAAGAAGAGSFDDCFAGMRDAVGSFQDTEKDSADGTVRMRIALETGDRFGTSGTQPWLPLRLALETPQGTVCVTDEALLADGYMVTHHNCTDELTFTQGDLEYTISNPDSTIDYGDPTIWIRPSMLTISQGGDTLVGPIRLDTVECTAPDSLDGYCRSGGPC